MGVGMLIAVLAFLASAGLEYKIQGERDQSVGIFWQVRNKSQSRFYSDSALFKQISNNGCFLAFICSASTNPLDIYC